MQQPPRGGTWVGNTCVTSKSYEIQVLPSEWLHASKTFPTSFLCNSQLYITLFLISFISSAITSRSFLFIDSHSYTNYYSFSRVGPMGGAHGGSFHNPLLDAHTGKIERTLSRVSAGTSVVFSGAIKSPTVKDFNADNLITPVTRVLE
ncbi:hypothetical protein V1477_011756 [Vespula maculifrons]|uniref:Uncharacterized protein n=1 Tax=Vespula maculifrons TaxID=7453 RepID=A0ABD2C038_VESMC